MRLQNFVSDNETIGRYDHIAGLQAIDVIPPGETRSKSIPCIHYEEIIDAAKGVHVLPAVPKYLQPLDIQISNCQLLLPKRDSLELKMIDALHRQIPAIPLSDIKILKRQVKIGLHNGHSFIGHGSYLNGTNGCLIQQLLEDKEDRDMLITAESPFRIQGYVPDAYMALIFMVEYTLGIVNSKNNHIDSKTLLADYLNGPVTDHAKEIILANAGLGMSWYIPCDGRNIHLTNKHRENGIAATSDGVDLELKLVKDEIYSILNVNPAVDPTNEGIENSAALVLQAQNKDAKETTDSKGRTGQNLLNNRTSSIVSRSTQSPLLTASQTVINNSRKKNQKTSNQENLAAVDITANAGSMIGFDILMIHPSFGEVKDGDDALTYCTTLNAAGNANTLNNNDNTIGIADRYYDDDHDRNDLTVTRRTLRRSLPRDEDDRDRDRDQSPRSSRFAITRKSVEFHDRTTFRRYPSRDDRDLDAVESIVSGDSEQSHVRLNRLFYESQKSVHESAAKIRADAKGSAGDDHDNEEDFEYERDDRAVTTEKLSGKSSLLQQFMQAKLVNKKSVSSNNKKDSDILTDIQYTIARKTVLPAGMNTSIISKNESYVRQLTRGAKSKLTKYGITDALTMDTISSNNQQQHGPSLAEQMKFKHDLLREAEDELSVHEINIQFAGFRLGPGGSSHHSSNVININSQGRILPNSMISSMKPPRAIYFTYQFYTCQPTRSEVLYLNYTNQSAQHQNLTNEVAVLLRDEADVRHEPPLIYRYLIDCSSSSPQERYEFAKYLATKSLYIDVYDADALLHLGKFIQFQWYSL